MTSRRQFLVTGLAAASTLAAPAVAQTAIQFPPELMPQVVPLKKPVAAGQIFIIPKSHFLYLTMEGGQAMRYGVGVGKAGLSFQGTATVDVKKEWPTWRPTDEMIERDPVAYGKYKGNTDVQPGGPGNPLGARALYLFQNGVNTFYAIHGTTQPSSIGRSVSNGCIRMLNEHVVDLYERVDIGTVVTVF